MASELTHLAVSAGVSERAIAGVVESVVRGGPADAAVATRPRVARVPVGGARLAVGAREAGGTRAGGRLRRSAVAAVLAAGASA